MDDAAQPVGDVPPPWPSIWGRRAEVHLAAHAVELRRGDRVHRVPLEPGRMELARWAAGSTVLGTLLRLRDGTRSWTVAAAYFEPRSERLTGAPASRPDVVLAPDALAALIARVEAVLPTVAPFAPGDRLEVTLPPQHPRGMLMSVAAIPLFATLPLAGAAAQRPAPGLVVATILCGLAGLLWASWVWQRTRTLTLLIEGDHVRFQAGAKVLATATRQQVGLVDGTITVSGRYGSWSYRAVEIHIATRRITVASSVSVPRVDRRLRGPRYIVAPDVWNRLRGAL